MKPPSTLCPCKDCPDRHPNCHSACDAYAQYSNERTRICEERRLQSNDHFAYVERVIKHKRRKNL